MPRNRVHGKPNAKAGRTDRRAKAGPPKRPLGRNTGEQEARTQECLYCRKEYAVVDDATVTDGLETHDDKDGKRCNGSDFPYYWHSRELELAEMYRKARKP